VLRVIITVTNNESDELTRANMTSEKRKIRRKMIKMTVTLISIIQKADFKDVCGVARRNMWSVICKKRGTCWSSSKGNNRRRQSYE